MEIYNNFSFSIRYHFFSNLLENNFQKILKKVNLIIFKLCIFLNLYINY